MTLKELLNEFENTFKMKKKQRKCLLMSKLQNLQTLKLVITLINEFKYAFTVLLIKYKLI